MTNEEAGKVLLMLKAAYPRCDDGLDERMAAARQDLMLSVLRLWNYETAMAAVREVVLSKTFYPAVAELQAAYLAVNTPRPEKRLALPAEGDAPIEAKREASEKIKAILGIEPDLGLKREGVR